MRTFEQVEGAVVGALGQLVAKDRDLMEDDANKFGWVHPVGE
jgi:hypothetical protein